MRSSIACARCRRSKIKCVNSGIDTTCRACESSGRECVYPTPAQGAGGSVKRDIAATGGDGDERNGEWDSPKRPRARKSLGTAPSSAKDAAKANSSVLEASILTPKVWESLFDLFQVHYSTLLPFLHPTTFLAQIRQLGAGSTAPSDVHSAGDHSQSPAPRGEASPLILLGLLALTARFHPSLIHYHSPSSANHASNPLIASEFYANALRTRLAGSDGADLASTDISRVQALLMLGLHEWGMCRGKSAWVYVGMAIRLSQVMGLSLDSENEQPLRRTSTPATLSSDAENRDQKDQNSDDVIEQETKRRTFWSCFILDRCLSSGKYRPRMIKVRDLDIQLPSDNAFAFGERVRTSRLNEGGGRRGQSYDARSGPQIPGLRNSLGFGDEVKLRPNGITDLKQWSTSSHRSDGGDSGIDRLEVGAEECILSRLIRVIRIWGSVAKWSCSGGRRVDRYPPWLPESRFSYLKELLTEFQEGLTRNFQYTQRNTDTHIMYKNTLAAYSLMHITYFLSVIVLHRAYLPFLTMRFTEPPGPVDEPLFPHAPEGFWRESARDVFKAARQMLELVRTCQERGVLIETPMVAFAIYNAAFIGVYAAHCNQMDQDGYLCSKPNSTDIIPGLGSQGQICVRRAIEILGDMRPRLKMAVGWFRTVHRLHSYLSRAKKDYRRSSGKYDIPPSESNLQALSNGRTPFGPFTAGQDELKLLDKVLSDLGYPEDRVVESNGIEEDANTISVNAVERGTASDTGSNAVKSESGDPLDPHTDGAAAGARRKSWVPVNSPGGHTLPASSISETERHDLGPVPRPTSMPTTRPLENGWTNPPPSYSLPPIQPQPPHSFPGPSLATSPNAPPRIASPSYPPHSGPSITSPNTYASSAAHSGPSTTSQPYIQNHANRLQPLQYPSRQSPAYTQSLPSISTAAQHGFPLPSLSTSTFGAQPQNNHHHHHHHHHTPPRFHYSPPDAALPLDTGNNNPWMSSLGGDDVVAFVEGGGFESWASLVENAQSMSPVVANGWLSAVWTE
ncbi:hypothetical protein AJ80_03858 [Polytolypa hystricis UAMH7299]|uniref:Zn(2)-C6 fungal-type domain-containing protein n=1 Tax=Polytolypa hystricis (strain UAMH7299) TaxID=1447883 RepID=A0A2B7YEQ9_POLH7|nr:hypothetical protein AJ80_03858 [Polytolypa hystricis UAMH7299]